MRSLLECFYVNAVVTMTFLAFNLFLLPYTFMQNINYSSIKLWKCWVSAIIWCGFMLDGKFVLDVP